jgi:hypothetical protein
MYHHAGSRLMAEDNRPPLHRHRPCLTQGAMAQAPLTLARVATAGTIVLIGVVLSCLSVGAFDPTPSVRRDDWRRTENGWERKSAWSRPAVLFAKRSLPKHQTTVSIHTRFDTHPAALALIQVVGALSALAAFAPLRALGKAHRPHWKATLARSFRASAFGS